MMLGSVALIWERLGEYHHARLERVARDLSLHAVEVAAVDQTYHWKQAERRPGYTVTTLFPSICMPSSRLKMRVNEVLTRIDPAVIAIPGWSAPYAILALDWARRKGRSIVIMSDSNEFDASRHVVAERVKRAVVAHATAGFAAGTSARYYLSKLGLPSGRITSGYDVVDNDHFAFPPGTPRSRGEAFLAVGRFIGRKNFSTLLRSYARYRARLEGGMGGWSLIMVGDGPDKAHLHAEARTLGIEDHVCFAGFQDYSALPGFYHRAGAFVIPSLVEQWGLVVNEAMAAGLPVLVSRRCGSAEDLVQEGVNGFLFDPLCEEELAVLMSRIAGDPQLAHRMGGSSLDIIKHWGLDRFAAGLVQAAKIACDGAASRAGSLDGWIIDALVRRAS